MGITILVETKDENLNFSGSTLFSSCGEIRWKA